MRGNLIDVAAPLLSQKQHQGKGCSGKKIWIEQHKLLLLQGNESNGHRINPHRPDREAQNISDFKVKQSEEEKFRNPNFVKKLRRRDIEWNGAWRFFSCGCYIMNRRLIGRLVQVVLYQTAYIFTVKIGGLPEIK